MMKMFNMKCLKKVLGWGVMYRVNNMDLRENCGNKSSLSWKEWIKVA